MGNVNEKGLDCNQCESEPAKETWPGKTAELMGFLRDNAQNEEAKKLIEDTIGPMVRRLGEIADGGKWPLADNVDDGHLAQLADDVAALTGRPAVRCITISMSEPCQKPTWMSEEAYQRARLTSLVDDIKHSFDAMILYLDPSLFATSNYVPDNFATILQDNLKVMSWKRLLVDCLWHGGLGDNGCRKFWLELQVYIETHMALSMYSGIKGDRVQTQRLARIVEAYAAGMLILGFKRDEPDVLLVLVA